MMRRTRTSSSSRRKLRHRDVSDMLPRVSAPTRVSCCIYCHPDDGDREWRLRWRMTRWRRRRTTTFRARARVCIARKGFGVVSRGKLREYQPEARVLAEPKKLPLGPQASTRAHVTTHRARRPCAIAAPAYQSPCVERPPRARAFDRPEVRRGNRSARATSPILPDDGPRRRDGDWGHEQTVLRSREDRTRREPSSRIF